MPASTNRRRMRTLLLALTTVVAAGLVAGCGDDDDDDGTPAAAQPAAFAIEATAEGKKKALTLPASVKAGLVTLTLKNSDTVPREAQIVRVEGDQTVDEVLEVVDSDEEEAEIPSFLQDGGGVPTVKPGATGSATQVLAPGNYVIFDTQGGRDGPQSKSNSELGAKGEFTVTGPAADAELPPQPATITATDDGEDDYSFEFSGLRAGANKLRFENTGEELHHVLFFPIVGDATIEDVTAAFEADGPPKGPPPVDFKNAVGSAVIDGDIAQNITLDLKAGRYAAVCFLNDREGGKPHAAEGMLEEVTIK